MDIEQHTSREELLAQGFTEKRNHKGTAYFDDETGEVVAKACTKCCEIKSVKCFPKLKGSALGVRADCKQCKNKQLNKWRGSNREHVNTYQRDWKIVNREQYLKQKAIDYGRNKMTNIRYYEVNKERLIRRATDWRNKNRVLSMQHTQLRRSRKYALPSDITPVEYEATCLYFSNACALSGVAEYIQADHVIPLSIGHGGTTYGNMIPLRNDLNLSKSAQHIFEWFDANKERFNLSQTKFDTLIAYLAEINGLTMKEYRAYIDYCFDNPRTLENLTTENESA